MGKKRTHSPLKELDSLTAEQIELINELGVHCKTQEDIQGIMQLMWKSLLERSLDVEMDGHLGYQKHSSEGDHSGNSRNGRTPKTVQGEVGPIEIETPRDRNSTFQPCCLLRFRSSNHRKCVTCLVL